MYKASESLFSPLCLCCAGAVLTAFIGVDGLVYQMATERCLPQIFLHKNTWRGTHHYIIFGFLALCVSQVGHTVASMRFIFG
jgi:amino acid transporter